MTFAADRIQDQIETLLFDTHALSKKSSYYVAYSGGVDSTVLLHMLAQLRNKHRFELFALHVNHGLQTQSDDWVSHCEQVCKDLDVPLEVTCLELESSSEQAARDGRYNWFRERVGANNVLLTAHHAQDRAETLLFNLMRGAGSAGLSSLRSARPFYGAKLVRPMLACNKHEIEQYAEQHQLKWIEDPSNQQTDYSRNHIRQHVLPTLTDFRSDALAGINRAAANLEQENSLLREIAISDLVEVREHPRHPLDSSHALCFEDFQHLSVARQANLVRFWLNSLQLHVPSKQLLAKLLNAFTAPPVSTAILQESGCQFRFYQGYVYVMPALDEAAPLPTIDWSNIDQPIDLYKNKIRVDATSKLRDLYRDRRQSSLRLTSRTFVKNPKALQGHTLNLKKWLQEIGIPPWRRQALPLLTLNQSNSDVVLGPVDQQFHSDWVLLECPVN